MGSRLVLGWLWLGSGFILDGFVWVLGCFCTIRIVYLGSFNLFMKQRRTYFCGTVVFLLLQVWN